MIDAPASNVTAAAGGRLIVQRKVKLFFAMTIDESTSKFGAIFITPKGVRLYSIAHFGGPGKGRVQCALASSSLETPYSDSASNIAAMR